MSPLSEEGMLENGLPANAPFPNNPQFGMNSGVGTQMAADSDAANSLLRTLKASKSGGAKKSKDTKTKTKSTKKSKVPKKKSESKKKSKSSKKMKGGEESWGATGMPPQFYDPKAPLASFPSNSGKGAKSAYGAIQPSDAGTGMLAPFTVSNSKTANPATNQQTGGRMRTIPSMDTKPPQVMSKIADKTYSAVKNFFKKLEKNYNHSVEKTKNIKIGNQRLIQGGAKKKKAVKKTIKKTEKKPKKKTSSKKKKGGDGSDWSMTANSRGPSNAPDNYMGVDGEKWFRQFNKTGEYIPNSKLARAAAPKLTGGPKVEKVMGFSTYESIFSPIKGGAKKKTTTKKKSVKKPMKKSVKKPMKKTVKKSKKKTTSKKK